MTSGNDLVVGLNAVIVAVTDGRPRILTVRGTEIGSADGITTKALPFGPLDPSGDNTLELALRHWVRQQTGIELGYVEQLYTFGDRDRGSQDAWGGRRVLSIGYLALVREADSPVTGDAGWEDAYAFFPWEDLRSGKPKLIDKTVTPALREWVASASESSERKRRQERVDICFGLHGSPWDGYRVLDRYELLYEAGLVYESWIDRDGAERPSHQMDSSTEKRSIPGLPMSLDHRRIVATALTRLRGKIRFRPVVFELLPDEFTLLHLQQVVEALSGIGLHKQNFRRLVERGGLVEGRGKLHFQTGGRPAELFRFRREVLRERPAPGVGLPSLKKFSS
jgi:hypothetical protein